MKLKSRLWLICRELTVSRTLYVFLWLTSSVIICIMLFAYMLKTYYIDAFYEDINRKNNFEFIVDILGTNYTRIDDINNVGFKSIKITVDDLSDEEFRFGNQYTSCVTRLLISDKYLGEQQKIAFISKQYSTEYNLLVGDFIEQIYDGDVIARYEVIGVLNDNTESAADVYIPFDTYYFIMRQYGIEIPHLLQGTLSNSAKYLAISQKAEELGIYLSSDYDDGFKFVLLIESIFYVFLLLMVIFSFVSLTSIYKIVMKRRKNFIRRFQLLGGKNSDVYFLYASISIIITIVSSTTSLVMLVPIKKELRKLILDGFGLTYIEKNNWDFIGLFVICLILISVISIVIAGRPYQDVKNNLVGEKWD